MTGTEREERRVIITGGSGKAGRYVVGEFVDHGYSVLNLDLKPPARAT